MSEFNQNKRLEERLRNRYDPDGTLSEELHIKYTPWGKAMSERSGGELVLIEHDEDRYLGQNIYETVVEARDPNPGASDKAIYGSVEKQLEGSLGEESYVELMNQLLTQPVSSEDPMTLIELLAINREQGNNTMFLSPHTSYMEIAILSHLRFVAEQGRGHINRNAIVMSKLLSRMSRGGVPVLEAARSTTNIILSSPISENTIDYDIPLGAVNVINPLFKRSYRSLMEKRVGKKGVELDVALTGRQVISYPKGAVGEDIEGFEMPEVAPTSAELIRHGDYIVPWTLLRSPVTGKPKMIIDGVIDVQKELESKTPLEIVRPIFVGMAGHIENFTGKYVDYPGSPRKLGRQVIAEGFK